MIGVGRWRKSFRGWTRTLRFPANNSPYKGNALILNESPLAILEKRPDYED